MDENQIKRLNTLLIYEYCAKIIKQESDAAFHKLPKTSNPNKPWLEEVNINWADELLTDDSDQLRFAQAAPHIMILSFTCELAIKALLTQKGIDIKNGHHLDYLFKKLPKKVQENIIRQVLDVLRLDEDQFHKNLKVNNKGFTDYRYMYELQYASVNDVFLKAFLDATKNELEWTV